MGSFLSRGTSISSMIVRLPNEHTVEDSFLRGTSNDKNDGFHQDEEKNDNKEIVPYLYTMRKFGI
jgi:hypothetical protein